MGAAPALVLSLFALGAQPQRWQTCWDAFTSAYGHGTSFDVESLASDEARRQYDRDVYRQRDKCQKEAGCTFFFDVPFSHCTKVVNTFDCTAKGTTQCLRRE